MIKVGATVELNVTIENWSVSRTDFMPNWFVASVSNSLSAVPIVSTADIADFVGSFTEEAQYKRYDYDKWAPYSPEERFKLLVKFIKNTLKTV